MYSRGRGLNREFTVLDALTGSFFKFMSKIHMCQFAVPHWKSWKKNVIYSAFVTDSSHIFLFSTFLLSAADN